MPLFAKRELWEIHDSTYPPGTAADVTLGPLLAESEQPVVCMVVGRDQPPGVTMDDAALAALNDPFARIVLRRGERPQSVDALLALLDAVNGASEHAGSAVPEQMSFVLGEGGQIPWNLQTAGVERALRFVVVRRGPGDREVMLSVDDQPGAGDGLLQVLAWDPDKRAYNFYQRRGGTWFYVGDGFAALDPPTRGRGPFDGHVNGSLVMKELRFPWLHWTSMSVSIPKEALPPSAPILDHRIFSDATGAETLEREVIVPGIDRWTEARLDGAIRNGRVTGADKLLRQVVQATSVNLVSSDIRFLEISDDTSVSVPWEILLNREFWTERNMLVPLTIRGKFSISGAHYLAAVRSIGMELRDAASGFAKSGDTFFALSCPSPAYEDLSVVRGLIGRRVIGRRLATALMAVDFPNPIQSARREALARHMPGEAGLDGGPGSVEAVLMEALRRIAEADPASAEAEVLERLALPDETAQRSALSAEVAAYIEALRTRLATAEGVLDLVRLVDSRRRYFRTLGISEFKLTLPFSNVPELAPALAMTLEGRVVERPADWIA